MEDSEEEDSDEEESLLQSLVNEKTEYQLLLDDWGSRDVLLGLVAALTKSVKEACGEDDEEDSTD